MNLPAYGITSHCRYVGCRDGDTVILRVSWWPDAVVVRLMDCWCCECDDQRPIVKKAALAAKVFANEVLSNGGELSLHLPGHIFAKGLVKALSFDRIPGHIFVGTEKTLSDMIVMSGHGWRTKDEQKAAEAKIMGPA